MTSTTMFTSTDVELMTRAIKLAKKGQYTTRPNPNVGCVLVDAKGNIVGEGWHQRAGEPHAEVNALSQAKGRAENGTAYVTLEPCSHFGRTPPCAVALVEAGIKRVVCAMEDPNPKVSGSGFDILKQAGIEVQSGLLREEAILLNEGFIQRMSAKRPFVTLKMASSLDGRTALSNGVSQWITSPEARADVQRYRAKSSAILSGSGTALADNPSLTVRHEELGYLSNTLSAENVIQPTRVLLDARNQLKAGLKVFENNAPVIVINGEHNSSIQAEHVQQQQILNAQGKVDLPAMLQFLAKQEINDLWIEAGSRLAGAFLRERLVDRLIIYMAPKLMGNSGMGLCDLPEFENMEEIISLSWKDMRMVGSDLKMTADIE